MESDIHIWDPTNRPLYHGGSLWYPTLCGAEVLTAEIVVLHPKLTHYYPKVKTAKCMSCILLHFSNEAQRQSESPQV